MFFSTEDNYSKRWFFPRYNGGKIHESVVTMFILEALEGAKCQGNRILVELKNSRTLRFIGSYSHRLAKQVQQPSLKLIVNLS